MVCPGRVSCLPSDFYFVIFVFIFYVYFNVLNLIFHDWKQLVLNIYHRSTKKSSKSVCPSIEVGLTESQRIQLEHQMRKVIIGDTFICPINMAARKQGLIWKICLKSVLLWEVLLNFWLWVSDCLNHDLFNRLWKLLQIKNLFKLSVFSKILH